MKTICITGTHGTGKSTFTGELQSICRRKSFKTIVVTEVADRCPYPLNRQTSTVAQQWIWREQLLAELKAKRERPDVIICDRSLMCNMCYLAIVEHEDAKVAFSEVYSISHEWMLSQYDYVCRLPLNEVWLKSGNNPKRCDDIDFARRIDAVMDNLVQMYVNIEKDDLIAVVNGM